MAENCCVCSIFSTQPPAVHSFESGQWKKQIDLPPSESMVKIPEACFKRTNENPSSTGPVVNHQVNWSIQLFFKYWRAFFCNCTILCWYLAVQSNELAFKSPLYRCSSCNICVHAKCYGIIDSISLSNWLCRRCQCGDDTAVCLLCFQRGGALKPTTGKRWAHVVCALVVPNVSFMYCSSREPIVVDKIAADQLNFTCSYCHQRQNDTKVWYHGCCVRCSFKLCDLSYHVTCALKEGVRFALSTNKADTIYSTCPHHTLKKPEYCMAVIIYYIVVFCNWIVLLTEFLVQANCFII